MKNLVKLGRGFWAVLLSPADECGIFPISARIGLYGFLLTILLYIQSTVFDSNELLTVVGFCSIVTIIETMWRKVGAGRKLIWHFCSLILLVALLSMLMNQAIAVREAWYRTNVLEGRVTELINSSPTAVIVADGLGNIKYINSHATEIIGWRNDEVVGKSLTILMRPHKIALHLAGFNKAAAELKEGTAKWIAVGDRIFRIVAKDQSVVKVQIYIVGIRFSSDKERNDKYPAGQDIEFYAIIQPVKDLLDPEQVEQKAEEIKQEQKADDKEAQKAGVKTFPLAKPQLR